MAYLVAVIGAILPGVIVVSEEFVWLGDRYSFFPEIKWGMFYVYYYLPLFLLFFLWTFLRILYVLYKAHEIEEKTQLKYIFLGYFLGGGGGLVFGLIAPIFSSLVDFVWIGRMGSFIFLTFTFVALLKYHLFNVKIITVELLASLISIIIFIKFIFSKSVGEQIISSVLLVAAVFLSVVFVRSITKDIKDRERIEQLGKDLVVANEQLRRLDKQKSDFVSIASHQLRTPLTAIKGYASLVVEGSFGKVPPKVHEAVTKIFESSQRMVMIVENFLTVSRIERGRMFYKFEILDLQKITKDMVEEMRVVAEGYGLDIRFREETGRVYSVRADFIKLKQVIHNLIDDSISHTAEGFIDVSISPSQHGDHITLSISDTGEGLIKTRLKQLFDKYEPDIITDELHKETGVELFIVKEIVKAHRGKIWVESEGLGRGLTFFVELPVIRGNKEL